MLLEGGGLPRSPSAPRALLGASARSSAKPSHNTCGLTPNQHVSSYSPRPLVPILSNLARNSPAAPSNIEFASLELQRFPAVSKNYRLKLCAKFVWARPAIARRRRGKALPPPTGTSAWSGSRGLSGAFFRVHHFAPQAAAPMPLLSAIASRTKAIEVGTGVIDMR